MNRAILNSGLALLLLLAPLSRAESPPAETARATFVVHCYDVGADALTGLPGVLAVERGWSGGREVDRVVYDPRQLSEAQLERRLKESGTYVETLQEENPP